MRPIDPMLALVSPSLPVGPDWSYEVKWDGYRALLYKQADQVVLRSRRQSDLTRSYPSVITAAATLRATTAILDGEIVALDAEGRPSFQALQHRTYPGAFALVFYAFDILELEGQDFAARPLVERRQHLAKVVQGSSILLSEPLPGTPAEIERIVRGAGLEGVVAKRLNSRYEPGQRSGAWTKVKFAHRQEFAIGGFRPDGDRVDALVVGYYHDAQQFLASGKVRAGLNAHLRRELFEMLVPLASMTCPFVNLPTATKGRWGEGITAEDMATFTWVKPRLVAEVSFTEWTSGGSLRHAAFEGLRKDKLASTIRRE